MTKKPYGLKCIDANGDITYTVGKIYPWDYENRGIYNDEGKLMCCIGFDPYNFMERSYYTWEIVEEK